MEDANATEARCGSGPTALLLPGNEELVFKRRAQTQGWTESLPWQRARGGRGKQRPDGGGDEELQKEK